METEYENYLWLDTFGKGESKEDDACVVWNGVEVEIRCIPEDGKATFIYRIHSVDWRIYKAAFPKCLDDCFDDVEGRLYCSRSFHDDADECHKIARYEM